MGSKSIEVDGPLSYIVSCDWKFNNFWKARVDSADPIDQISNKIFQM